MKNTQIDYKKELEAASKSMIMIHDPKLLIKLISHAPESPRMQNSRLPCAKHETQHQNHYHR